MTKQQRLDFNQRNIAEFRASGGKIASFGDAPLLLLTTVGARSGKKRVNPMLYMADGADPGRLYVFASAAGAERNPAWYVNLVAHPEDLTVEIGDEKLTASAAALPEPERARVFAKQANQYSGFADYQAKTDRRIPVVALALNRDSQ
jgi:deazaflavin-dependent oxidoreductase (nitroreductase family)